MSSDWSNLDEACNVARDMRLMLNTARDLLAPMEQLGQGVAVPLSLDGAAGLVVMLDFLVFQLQRIEGDLGKAQKKLVNKAG